MGSKAGSELASVSSEDLDTYIAELIVQKSRTKQASADQRGIASYLEPDDAAAARVPNTNKRFLASIIRNVEGHNSALRRQQQRSEQRSAPSSRAERSGSSKMRGWSDDERDPEEKARSGRSDVQLERFGEEMSSKMDKYFEEPDPDLESRQRQRRSERKEDRQSSSNKRRHDKERASARDGHGHSSHRSLRSSRSERSERSEQSRGGRSHPDDGASDDDHRHHRRSHTSRRSSDRKSEHKSRSRKWSASPPPAPSPPKVREWDLGK
ncbi:uncharacterized protein PAN0_002d1279 [Moesziomyces antarcticus]|uniref:Uncharacterized protein n=1 Tax=Pseudozyma antarctica TaxID=84753 RepID=A0A5C3FJ04_PSEA2|nr:uncharacterized protein PAN0_002d1279 [Moesziomyces antarcticus]GAK63077.1 conserved hypothetical protein [Moesziomyces antarcticus]SPO43439.1 uncharacterized protein PSANT_01124 [Moesziomyces antarcticus]